MNKALIFLPVVLAVSCTKPGRNIASRKHVIAWLHSACTWVVDEGMLADATEPVIQRYEERYRCSLSDRAHFAKAGVVARGQHGERRDDPDVCSLAIGPFLLTAAQDWAYLSDVLTDTTLASKIQSRLLAESKDATGFDLIFIEDGVKVVAQLYGSPTVASGLLRIDGCSHYSGSASHFESIPYRTQYFVPQ